MATRKPAGKQVRYAVVGQGYIAQAAVLPAFAHAKSNSRLVALVSGDATKRRELARRYDVVHVLCEKPLAVDERECEAMIAACRRHGVKLMTAYRLHFEKATLSALASVGKGLLGEVRLFNSSFTMTVADADNIRLGDPAIGGGTFYDIGIYCINAARHVFRAEPTEVVAMATEPRKGDAEESAAAILRFPGNRLATFCVSFGTDKTSEYRVVGTRGSLRVEPAYELASGLEHHVTQGKKERTLRYSKRDQFAPELLYFSDCVLAGRDPEPSGGEGLADVRVIRALYRSAKSGRPVKLARAPHRKHPSSRQEIRRPPVRMRRLVNAAPPSG